MLETKRLRYDLLRNANYSPCGPLHVSGGGVVETRGFYDAANALGMLVYREFWMTG